MPGTLDTLILRGLSWGPKQLHRIEERDWIAAEWGTSQTGRRARSYRLTPAGKKQLVAEQSDWSDYVAAVGRVMRTTTEPA